MFLYLRALFETKQERYRRIRARAIRLGLYTSKAVS